MLLQFLNRLRFKLKIKMKFTVISLVAVFFTEFITYFGSENPIDFMQFIIDVSNDTLLPFGGFLITMYVAYVWKKKNLTDEISKGNPTYKGSLMEKYINFSVTFICPLILGSIFLLTFLNKFFGI